MEEHKESLFDWLVRHLVQDKDYELTWKNGYVSAHVRGREGTDAAAPSTQDSTAARPGA